LNLPNWAITLVIVLLAVGFPVALLFAWIQHLAPGGPLEQAKTNRLDWILAAGLAGGILLLIYERIAPPAAPLTSQQNRVEGAKTAAASPATAISVAVLPFANMSGDESQKFFSDGMTEEITSALAKVPDLRVVARTSAFQINQQNRDIQDIARQLHATHVIEG